MSGKTKERVLLGAILLFACLIIVALSVPVMDGPQMWKHVHESAAVGTLRQINTFEKDFANSHAQGYSCELSALRPADSKRDNSFDPYGYLSGQSRSRYRFSLSDCLPMQSKATHYTLVAVPSADATGHSAFCTDEQGVIWYDESGDAAKCLANRKLLQ